MLNIKLYNLLKNFFGFIIILLISTNNLSSNTYNYKEQFYLFNQKPIHIDPNKKIKSTFNFPNLIFNKFDISPINPIKKQYKIRRNIPKANLN